MMSLKLKITAILILISSFFGSVFTASAQADNPGITFEAPAEIPLDDLARRKFPKYFGNEDVGHTILVERFYPIGWSRDGKFAYYIEPPDEACGCYFAELVIQDMRTDKIVWHFKANNESETIPETETIETFWKKNQVLFSQKLSEHAIVPSEQKRLFERDFVSAGDTFTPILKMKKQHSADWGYDIASSIELDLRSAKSGTKRIHFVKYGPGSYPMLEAAVAGTLISPFEGRAAVVWIQVVRGWEGPPHITSTEAVGADLTRGFRKIK